MISERQEQIILVLENQTDWITLLKIGKLIGVSDKTVHQDVKIMNDALPENWNIISRRGKGVKLKKPSNESLDILVNVDRDVKTSRRLLEKILSRKNYTIDLLSYELYIETKSVSHLLKSAEPLLKQFQLELSRNPLKIHGSELMKRLLLYKLHKEEHGETALFFNLYKENHQLFLHVDQQMKSSNILLYPLPLAKMLIFIKISITRYQDGFLIDDIPNPNYIKQLELYKSITPLFTLLEEYFSVSLKEEEYIHIFFAFIYSEFYFEEIKAEPNKVIASIKSGQSEYKLLLDFIMYLEERLHCTLIENENILLSLYDFHKKILLRSINELYNNAGSRSSSLLVKDRFPKLYKTLQSISSEWTELHGLSPFTTDSVSALTLIIQRYFVESGHYQQHICYIYSETIDLKQLTISILNNRINNDIVITPIPLHKWEYKQHEQFDIILTDTPVEKSNERFILIEKIPSEKDIETINSVLKSRLTEEYRSN